MDREQPPWQPGGQLEEDASACLLQGGEGRPAESRHLQPAPQAQQNVYPETWQSNGAKFPAEMDDLRGVCCSGNSRKPWITSPMRKS